MSNPTNRARFDALRARYVAASAKFSAVESALRSKYGGSFEASWCSAAEGKKLTAAREAVSKSGSAFFAHLTDISPRDWSYGVPSSWLCEQLSYDDAVRPLGESLSVVPPLSYGASSPRV